MLSRDNPYYQQVELLIAVLPVVARYSDFALKGGTAINLFVQPMPRLSMDIDLTYLPINDRETALADITNQLNAIASELETTLPGTQVQRLTKNAKLHVTRNNVKIKLEVSPVLRGTVLTPVTMDIDESAEESFGYVAIQTLHQDELYAGKFCAALDRQHPRDLFDVMMFMQTHTITEQLLNVFIVYLLSSNRPVAEMLKPNLLNITDTYHKQFKGMTVKEVTLQELEHARKHLLDTITHQLSSEQKQFILSFKQGQPDWQRFAYPKAQMLSGIQWKLRNIQAMADKKRQGAITNLEQVLIQ